MRVVTLGGGTGQYHVLRALVLLQKSFELSITAIPTTMDSGGSSGELRLDHRVVAPGDIGQCMFGLCKNPERDAWLFNHRFGNGKLSRHSLRNAIVVAALEWHNHAGDRAMAAIRDTFGLLGDIAPVTFEETHVQATLRDGSHLCGEAAIYDADLVEHGGIENLWLKPPCSANPNAIEAIAAADVIIVCPGTLACSIAPNFLVEGVAEALRASPARRIYIANLMNERRRVPSDWSVGDYLAYLEKYLGAGFFDTVICNTESISRAQARVYEKERVAIPPATHLGGEERVLIALPLVMKEPPAANPHDPLAEVRASVRHDPEKLAWAMQGILSAVQKEL